ncbi:hypothetical protein BC628DRAFT_541257 [Trametes gibbosa]|nr:hypothetical protein BC628DRAFT_541257 [Trametes gibbosa]
MLPISHVYWVPPSTTTTTTTVGHYRATPPNPQPEQASYRTFLLLNMYTMTAPRPAPAPGGSLVPLTLRAHVVRVCMWVGGGGGGVFFEAHTSIMPRGRLSCAPLSSLLASSSTSTSSGVCSATLLARPRSAFPASLPLPRSSSSFPAPRSPFPAQIQSRQGPTGHRSAGPRLVHHRLTALPPDNIHIHIHYIHTYIYIYYHRTPPRIRIASFSRVQYSYSIALPPRPASLPHRSRVEPSSCPPALTFLLVPVPPSYLLLPPCPPPPFSLAYSPHCVAIGSKPRLPPPASPTTSVARPPARPPARWPPGQVSFSFVSFAASKCSSFVRSFVPSLPPPFPMLLLVTAGAHQSPRSIVVRAVHSTVAHVYVIVRVPEPQLEREYPPASRYVYVCMCVCVSVCLDLFREKGTRPGNTHRNRYVRQRVRPHRSVV